MGRLILLAATAFLFLAAPNAAYAEDENASKPATRDAGVHLIIRFQVDEDRLVSFMDIMTNIDELMAEEEGFIDATVYRDNDDQLSFTLVEKWRTRDLHRKHYDAIVASGDWAGILDMLTAEPEMSYNAEL